MSTHTFRAAKIAVAASLLTAPFASAALSNYSQNFEGLAQADTAALASDGWTVFANVFTFIGGYYNYGPFVAPNAQPPAAFSGIVTGEGGAEQGAQQLVIISDYNNQGSQTAMDSIEANVYRESSISAADVGKTYVFSFDAKKGNIVAPTQAVAFVKTLDPAAQFATTNFFTVDTAAVLTTTWNRYSIEITIDAGLVGQLLQFGFNTTTTNNTPSGNFYDNIVFAQPDTDGDGVADAVDNCTLLSNPSQFDGDGDGIGNRCDADLNNDCVVNPVDLGIFRAAFFTANAVADLDGNGVVNTVDLGILRSLFFMPPGPPFLCGPM